MTRGQWNVLLPKIHAFIEGKTITYRGIACGDDIMFGGDPDSYKIVESPKIRPMRLGELPVGAVLHHVDCPPGDDYLVTHAGKVGVSSGNHSFDYDTLATGKWKYRLSANDLKWHDCTVEEKCE